MYWTENTKIARGLGRAVPVGFDAPELAPVTVYVAVPATWPPVWSWAVLLSSMACAVGGVAIGVALRL